MTVSEERLQAYYDDESTRNCCGNNGLHMENQRVDEEVWALGGGRFA